MSARLFATCLLAVGILAAAPVGAQQAPRPPAQAAAAPAVSASHLAVAGEVLRGSGMNAMFDNAMPNVVGALRANLSRQRPELIKEIEEALKVVSERQAVEVTEGFTTAARLLAARLDEGELKEINTFLSSAAGKKYVAVLPAFTEEIVPFLEIWNREVAARLTNLFQAEMVKRGHRL